MVSLKDGKGLGLLLPLWNQKGYIFKKQWKKTIPIVLINSTWVFLCIVTTASNIPIPPNPPVKKLSL